MLKIGSLKLKSNLILAPLAGISDLPFRMLNRRFGAELGFVEMINCRSMGFKSKRTLQMLSTHPEDRPLGVQLLGCEEEYILKALGVLKKYEFDLLDFNAACPAKKVARRGEGASLLRDPKLLHKLLKLVVKHSKKNLPVTVKIRSGWDKNSVNAREVALLAEDAGVDGLFIHGRTKTQGYSGDVDYKAIAEVKKALEIPVIASGNIFTAQLIKKMFDETGCDGVAVARGALGNPWIFSGKQPNKEEIIATVREHLEGCIRFYGERIGVMKFRKFFIWYTKGMSKVRHLREECSRAKTLQGVVNIIEHLGR